MPILNFVASRMLQLIIMLFIISFVIYFLIGLMPGDPIDIMLAANPEASATDAARLRAIYGLDKSIFERYLNWLGSAMVGDFGYSRLYGRPVLEILLPKMGNSLILMGGSLLIAVPIATIIGVYAAHKHNSFFDRIVNLFAFAGISIPAFWLALLFMSLFSVYLGWLPASGNGAGEADFLSKLKYYILPVATLAFASIGGYTRYVRGSMIEALSSQHIQTARAKGCSENKIIWHHAFPTALIYIVTIIALDFGTFFSGALITETMFAWPGMGKLIYDSILGNDFNMALIALLFSTFFVLFASFVADILYMILDPRVNLTEA